MASSRSAPWNWGPIRPDLGVVGLGLLLVLVGISGLQKDVRLRLWGSRTPGGIVDVYELRDAEGPRCDVVYYFVKADGLAQRGSTSLPVEWKRPAGGTLQIVYLPGDPEVNAIVGEGPSENFWAGLVVFLLGLPFLACGGCSFHLDWLRNRPRRLAARPIASSAVRHSASAGGLAGRECVSVSGHPIIGLPDAALSAGRRRA
jgi:hypothetical protein